MTKINDILFIRSNRRNRRGSTMVEFALVAGLMFFITFASIQFAIIYSAMNSLSQISREAARFAAVHATESGFDGTSGTLQTYVNTVKNGTTLNNATITATAGYMDSSTPPVFQSNTSTDTVHRSTGLPVTVMITYDMTNKVIGSGTWLQAAMFKKVISKYSTMTIE